MATGDRVKDAVKPVLAAQKAEKRKGQELEAFVTFRKASDSCANLLARGASDKQRSVLEKNAAKCNAAIQRLMAQLSPEQLEAALAMAGGAPAAAPAPTAAPAAAPAAPPPEPQQPASPAARRRVRALHAWNEAAGTSRGDLHFDAGCVSVFSLRAPRCSRVLSRVAATCSRS